MTTEQNNPALPQWTLDAANAIENNYATSRNRTERVNERAAMIHNRFLRHAPAKPEGAVREPVFPDWMCDGRMFRDFCEEVGFEATARRIRQFVRAQMSIAPSPGSVAQDFGVVIDHRPIAETAATDSAGVAQGGEDAR